MSIWPKRDEIRAPKQEPEQFEIWCRSTDPNLQALHVRQALDLYYSKPVTPVQIATDTGIGVTTVLMVVERLIDARVAHLLVEKGPS